ncbi:hypothetical protein N658DRAFT_284314 [Parathielavia hyrcaniae]|uniref:Uncharacterized protein n=1 Tax=Parathielavia hyrcaniae TaxID=113614 RepID=A0AAN6T3F2_9PEZI|nr:hypothetical protein N658DRAFT_284314 [Parathielavia hyrcaniae]
MTRLEFLCRRCDALMKCSIVQDRASRSRSIHWGYIHHLCLGLNPHPYTIYTANITQHSP